MSRSKFCRGRSMRIVVSTTDAEIIVSQPGLGPVLGARVLAEFGDDPDRYADAKSRKNYAGTSPITRASGKKKTVLTRFVHNDRLIDALMTQAFSALNASPGARAYYDQLKARGTEHTAALRQLANRLVASCTATSKPTPATTKRPHDHIASSRLPLDIQAPGMSDKSGGRHGGDVQPVPCLSAVEGSGYGGRATTSGPLPHRGRETTLCAVPTQHRDDRDRGPRAGRGGPGPQAS